jgi:coenzyme F420 hydrogenase subunit beta
MTRSLSDAVASVVSSGNCSGCGGCATLDSSLLMKRSKEGFNRPVPEAMSEGRLSADARIHQFDAMCPGIAVSAQAPKGSRRHEILGPYTGAWQAWASDENVRFAGSSGGALSALGAWLLDGPEFDCVVTAGADLGNVAETIVLIAGDGASVKAAAGSRYAPVSIAAAPLAHMPRSVVVGKPCEVSCIRARNEWIRETPEPPFLLSFFCAGVPSQNATDKLLECNFDETDFPLRSLRYRGNGWPGGFEAVGQQGDRLSVSYDESWGKHLGPTTQWRCKVCPDGVGESADVVAGDFWHANARGYPILSEQPGRSVLIARTERGLSAVLAAAEGGVLILEPIDLDDVVKVQPLQDSRRRTLVGRLIGACFAGRPVPRYYGFRLLSLGFTSPAQTARAMIGTFRRSIVWRRRRSLVERGGADVVAE